MIDVDIVSVWRGIKAMTWKRGKVNYAVRFHSYRPFHAIMWTPKWHLGRGFYFSVGLWFISFYRGY